MHKGEFLDLLDVCVRAKTLAQLELTLLRLMGLVGCVFVLFFLFWVLRFALLVRVPFPHQYVVFPFLQR